MEKVNEEKDTRSIRQGDLLRHAEHMCSVKVSSCGAEERAKRNADPLSKKDKSVGAEDICTPLFTGV